MEFFIEAVDLPIFAATDWRALERRRRDLRQYRLNPPGRTATGCVSPTSPSSNASSDALVENAIRFTKDGAIEIVVDATQNARPDGEAGCRSRCATPARASRRRILPTCSIFSSIATTPRRAITALAGLGLPLCDRLCRLLDGSLTVESELGRASTFTIRLPRGRARRRRR